jgi:hypothetical protein
MVGTHSISLVSLNAEGKRLASFLRKAETTALM